MSIFANPKELLFQHILLALANEQQKGLSWWAWLIIIILVFLILWLLWWWLRHPQKENNVPTKPTPPISLPPQQPTPPVAVPVVATPVPSAPAKLDDLTIIEGIGPKIASVLQTAGITSFTQLAEAEMSNLQKILLDAGLDLADPSTWKDQARLAAEGKWDELKVLQDSLKGGRRVE